MPYGTENLIGTGHAQVFPRGKGYEGLMNNLQEQRRFQFQQQRAKKADEQQKNSELYSLIGNELNPRDFNSVIHYKVKKAQEELANQILTNKNMDYGQMYLAAHNKAAELGQLSDSLNRVDQQISLTKKEYEGDKRINSGAVEIAARKKILDQIEKGGRIDESVNYFDDILNSNPDISLIDNSDATFSNLKPDEKQPLKFNVNKRNPVGKTMQYTWDFDNYPVYYDVEQKGDFETPSIKTKNVPSGVKNASGKELPMLTDEAYGRFALTPSDVVALNRRIKKQNPDIDLHSQEAEKLRKIEAYKDVDVRKPVPRESIVEKAPLPPRISIRTGSADGQTTIRDVYQDVYDRTKRARDEGKPYLQTNLLEGDSQSVVLDEARKATGDSQLGYRDIKIILDKDDKLGIYDATNNQLIKYLTKVGTNVKAQPSVKEKREVIKQGEAKPKTEDFRKKYNY